MEVHVLKVYPQDTGPNEFKAICHVYLPEIDIEIRGVFARKRFTRWYVTIPMKREKTVLGKSVEYPIVSMGNPAKKADFDWSIRTEVIHYIETQMLKHYT